MKELENRLSEIGFRSLRPEPECWRVTRLGVPTPSAPSRARRDPVKSRILSRWLDRLSDRNRPSPYRIAPMNRGRALG